ncbi:MAG: hypothetical protein ACK40Q_02755 [Pseudothermotoga sp.]
MERYYCSKIFQEVLKDVKRIIDFIEDLSSLSMLTMVFTLMYPAPDNRLKSSVLVFAG